MDPALSETKIDCIEDTVTLIRAYGSNHPRRINCIAAGHVSLRALLRYVQTGNSGNTLLLFLSSFYKYAKSFLRRRIFRIVDASGLPKTLYVLVGDSHSEFAGRVSIKPSAGRVVSLWLGPALGYTFGSTDKYDHLISDVIGELLKESHYKQLCIIMTFAEIDIRTQAWAQIRLKQLPGGSDQFAEKLAQLVSDKSLSLINHFSERYPSLKTCGLIIQPSPPSSKDSYEPLALEEYYELRKANEFPRFGNLGFRLEVYKKYNERLKEILSHESYKKLIGFVSLEHDVFGSDLSLSSDASDDGCHISNVHVISKNFKRVVDAYRSIYGSGLGKS
jgi:hypothetical protein